MAPTAYTDHRAFPARLEALGKRLLGVLVAHPHADHHDMIVELLAGEDVPVILHRDLAELDLRKPHAVVEGGEAAR